MHLEKLLNNGSDTSGTQLFLIFLLLRSLTSDGELKDNTGYATRLNYPSNSNTIELYGRLHADLFKFDQMLINGVDMNIKLTCAPEVSII